jgi:hypothetical protein
MREVLQQAVEALREIRDLEPRPFDGIPTDWDEQIAACPECQRYKGHPIQCGICDQHRKPLWARERHDENERLSIGWRAKDIAREALAAAESALQKQPEPVAEAWEREDVEAVADCLGDDAAQLRQENDEDERASNMDRAASMLTWMLLTHPAYTSGVGLPDGAKR